MSHLNSRVARIVAGLAVVSAFAVAPMAAQAADTDVTGTLGAGTLTFVTPTIGSVSTTLTGANQTLTPAVGAWSITDASGSDDGYSITVAASVPTVGGVTADAGTGGTLTLTAPTATPRAGNPLLAADGPLPQGTTHVLSTTAVPIENAAAGKGQGSWDFTAGTMSVVIPGDANAGVYLSTMTYTQSTPA